MQDVRGDLGSLWRSMSGLGNGQARTRAIMFVAAHDGEGTTSVAASFAVLAARRTQRMAWLVDLDLRHNPAFAGFEAGFSDDVGQPGRAFDAGLGQTPFYQVVPAPQARAAPRLLTAHEIENERLLVTRFRNERVDSDQWLELTTSPAWWQALRKAADWIVVDAPSLQRSPAALAMASQQDGVVLVVQADRTRPQQVAAARRELEAHGANIQGVVLNQVRADAA